MDIKIDKQPETGKEVVVVSQGEDFNVVIIPELKDDNNIDISFVSRTKRIVDVYQNADYPQRVVLMFKKEPDLDNITTEFLYVNLLEKENEAKQELLKKCYEEIQHKNKIIGHSNNKIGEIRKFKKRVLEKFKDIYGELETFVKGTDEQNDAFVAFVASHLLKDKE